ncbi:MAG: cupredoxin domain-containing protein [Chloroflexi bacterium]|nr:cupredoxin domain-containing protein [Chloroflexota bacterium]
MKKFAVLLIVVLSLSFVLSACGPKTTTLNVVVNDFSYTPTTFTVSAGVPVTLVVKNNGSTEHEFALMKKGTSVAPPFGDKDEGNIYWELDEIAPGSTKTGTFTAPTEPGEYEIICGLAGHIEKGMVATLIVK